MPNPATSVSREIVMLRRSLKAMDRSLRRLGPKLRRAVNHRNGARPGPRTWKLKLSPKRRAQLKLQGQYIGYMRNLKPKQKAEVMRLKETKGMEAATRKAKALMAKASS
jgi:hypothetical protein